MSSVFMKGAYTIDSAYSNAYVLRVFMKGVYTINNVYSWCLNVLKVLMVLTMCI